MPKSSRLSREELDAFFRGRPRRVSGTLFDLAFLPREKGIKAACVVSKKIAPLAVSRNRIRRQVRAALSGLMEHASPSMLVFTARAGALTATSREVAADITSLVSRARVTYNGTI